MKATEKNQAHLIQPKRPNFGRLSGPYMFPQKLAIFSGEHATILFQPKAIFATDTYLMIPDAQTAPNRQNQQSTPFGNAKWSNQYGIQYHGVEN